MLAHNFRRKDPTIVGFTVNMLGINVNQVFMEGTKTFEICRWVIIFTNFLADMKLMSFLEFEQASSKNFQFGFNIPYEAIALLY